MVKCKRCDKQTDFDGTQFCNRCWELESRITNSMKDAMIAACILEEMGFHVLYPALQSKKEVRDKDQNETRIIIELKGGLVQAVWSTDGTIKAEIMDRDLPETDEDGNYYTQEIAKQEVGIRNLKMVDISE